MSEAIWYFADGDEERGPVTEAQVRALIGTGNLKPDDLVWKEGMEDWAPAGEVPGLFDKEPAAPAAPPVDSPARGATPSEKRKAEPQDAKRPARAPAERARVTPVSFDFSKAIDRFKSSGSPGLLLFVAGFMLVLLAKGCDSLATRHVARIKAKSQVAESHFQDEWDRQRSAIERRQESLDRTDPGDRQELNSLAEELEQLKEEKEAEKEELLRGKWRDLSRASRDAEANNDMWAFWREGFFWFGTLVFSFGLMVVGFTGKGAYRWMCLIMLAIIVFSLYVGRA